MTAKLASLIGLVALLPLLGFGQQYLYVQRNNEVPDRRFELYEDLSIYTIGAEDWMKGKITAISSEYLEIEGVKYALADIEAIRVSHDLWYVMGSGMLAGGILFPAVAGFNQAINGANPFLTAAQATTGAILISAGLLTRWLSRSTYRRNKGWHWKVIDFQNLANE